MGRGESTLRLRAGATDPAPPIFLNAAELPGASRPSSQPMMRPAVIISVFLYPSPVIMPWWERTLTTMGATPPARCGQGRAPRRPAGVVGCLCPFVMGGAGARRRAPGVRREGEGLGFRVVGSGSWSQAPGNRRFGVVFTTTNTSTSALFSRNIPQHRIQSLTTAHNAYNL